MNLPQTEIEYRNALIDAAELGAIKALVEIGQLKPYLKLNEAGRKYGLATVKRWHDEGLIEFIKDGPRNSTVRINRIQLESVARTSNRSSYLSKIERNNS